jgi:hypothetical protein
VGAEVLDRLRALLNALPPEDYRRVCASWTEDGAVITFSVEAKPEDK